MVDMSKFGKDTPAQARERLQWTLDVIRENQSDVLEVLNMLLSEDITGAKTHLSYMHKGDRDAILQEGGILTSAQIELLKE